MHDTKERLSLLWIFVLLNSSFHGFFPEGMTVVARRL
jgi:hypothetical protein